MGSTAHLSTSKTEAIERQKSEDEVPEIPPLFLTELLMEPEKMVFTPTRDEFLEGVHSILEQLRSTSLSVGGLVGDENFDAFTQ